nr:hypothetical protein [candidate division Zixibacteria bacterium]
MKRALIFAMAVCLLVSSAAMATMTRTLTMGEANTIIHDDNNIWQFPSRIVDYPDMAVGEFSYNTGGYYYYWDEFTDIGVHYNLSDETPFVIGAYFTTVQPNQDFPYFLTSEYYDEIPNHRIDLFVGTHFSDMKAGMHFGYLSGSYETEQEDGTGEVINETEYSTKGYGFGFGLTAMENKLDLAAELTLLSWTDKGDNGYDITEPDGCMLLDLSGRMFHEMNQKFTLVPHGGLEFGKVANKEYDNWDVEGEEGDVTDKDKYSRFILDAGMGVNYTPAEGVLAIADFGFMYYKEKEEYSYWDDGDEEWIDYEYEYSWFTLPYFKVGMEAKVFNWMDIRMGGTSYWEHEKDKYTYPTGGDPATYTNEYRYGYVNNATYLGLGFHWGQLKIDTYINPEIIVNGFNFISGTEQDMNYQVSVKYDMF